MFSFESFPANGQVHLDKQIWGFQKTRFNLFVNDNSPDVRYFQLPKDIFPGSNFPTVQFTKRKLPKSVCSSHSARPLACSSRSARPQTPSLPQHLDSIAACGPYEDLTLLLESCRLGSCHLGKALTVQVKTLRRYSSFEFLACKKQRRNSLK